MSYTALIETLGRQAREASLALATAETSRKNTALTRLAELLAERVDVILVANERDIVAANAAGLAKPMIERLTLNKKRIAALAESVRQVAALPDPVGEELERITRPNGLDIRKISVPIGVIAIIYESRPNVTIECAVLCLKSGNACILRGGKEAFETNTVLAALCSEALAASGLGPKNTEHVSAAVQAQIDAAEQRRQRLGLDAPNPDTPSTPTESCPSQDKPA